MARLLSRRRLDYYRRLVPAYLPGRKSQLTFWHDTPAVNENARTDELGEYYMRFTAKADYDGQYDGQGIPLLNYHGKIGLQYNPIAVAQFGLGNFNLFRQTGDGRRRSRFLAAADWLKANLEETESGVWGWAHHFEFEYRTTLIPPWYSGLAQGQGISLLARAHVETGQESYLDAAQRAFGAFRKTMDEGGVVYVDDEDGIWLEEYLVSPPTHVLNGFIWATWGVYDLSLLTRDPAAKHLFERAVETLVSHLPSYDTGSWSLYELSGSHFKMLASPFYHRLHIVQLQVQYRLTGEEIFLEYARRWEEYRRSPVKRTAALLYKIAFKLGRY